MAALLIVLAIAAVLTIWIVVPLTRLSKGADQSFDPEVDALIDEKNAVLRSIVDLEADARVGKVSGEDALVMRSEQELAAARILRRLDQSGEQASALRNGSVKDPSAEVEEEIARARERLNKRRDG